MNILITGANGFIGKNLRFHLAERKNINVTLYTRDQKLSDLKELISKADFIFHLAGVNRPEDPREFKTGNFDLTKELVNTIKESKSTASVIYTSSVQAELDNPYGKSKLDAEKALLEIKDSHKISIFRLPGVFGKWARPNYNSVVATFCHNIANDLPISLHDPSKSLHLVYIDDVIHRFLEIMDTTTPTKTYDDVAPIYKTTIGDLATRIEGFKNSRKTLITDEVGTGFLRALYATYISYLPVNSFIYDITKHEDRRGVFVEMLKTPTAGQFSFFTAHPGLTRGGHYHHTKTEKFLVLKGQARFRFRHMITNELFELTTTGTEPQIVETIPGWTHDITNTGDEELYVMLWANEIFDRTKPDTYACPITETTN